MQPIVKFIALSYRYCSTCFGHYNPHHQEPVTLPLQPLVSVWMWRWKHSQPWSVSYGNQRLQRQFGGLLMMGIVMPETYWAVSVRQGNKFYDWLVASSWLFYSSEDIAMKQTYTTDIFLFISHTTNVLLFKFRCNISIAVSIIKKMPGSVASGTPCIIALHSPYGTVSK